MSSDKVATTHFEKEIRFIPDAFAMIYDLAEFSRFANQPDAARYVPRILNLVMSIITEAIGGGTAWWEESPIDWDPLTGLIHRKFLGDGELLIFENGPEVNVPWFLNRFFNVQNNFPAIRERFEDVAPMAILPTAIRFGIARGSLYELTSSADKIHEYVGVCINLASRLQSYAPPLNIIASARTEMTKIDLKKNGWERVYAISLKGFEPEAVIIDAGALENIPQHRREALFSQTRPEA